MIQVYISNNKLRTDYNAYIKAFFPNNNVKFIENKDRLDKLIINDKTIILDIDDKKIFQKQLYKELSLITNKELPWGLLIGIRPTKLIYDALEQGKTQVEIEKTFKEQYFISKDKIDLSIKIAKREKEILDKINYKEAYSLYIGIPFCPSTCLYCSFTSYSIEKFAHLVDEYLDALEKEIKYASKIFNDKKLTSIYIGGGTPTSLNEKQLERLLKTIHKHFNVSNLAEFSLEAGRPDSLTYEKLKLLKDYQVGRISINPQTMVDRTLKLIGRNHTSKQIVEAYKMARKLGHDNINMDLIMGLIDEKIDDVKHTLSEIKKLNPESLTVHSLAIKRAAKLNIEKDKYKRYNSDNVLDMINLSMNHAIDNNYFPYYLYRQKNISGNLENIGYAKHGKECIYNILIMEEKQTILALGAGAVSKFVYYDRKRIERIDNLKSVTDYIARIDEMIEKKDKFIREDFHDN